MPLRYSPGLAYTNDKNIMYDWYDLHCPKKFEGEIIVGVVFVILVIVSIRLACHGRL